MKAKQQHQPYLIFHVKHIVSQTRVDRMYLEYVNVSLLDHLTLNASGDRETLRVYEDALIDLMKYEQRTNQQNNDIEDDIRLIQYIGALDKAGKGISKTRKTSKLPVIAEIEDDLFDKQGKTRIRSHQAVEKDIRLVSRLSATL